MRNSAIGKLKATKKLHIAFMQNKKKPKNANKLTILFRCCCLLIVGYLFIVLWILYKVDGDRPTRQKPNPFFFNGFYTQYAHTEIKMCCNFYVQIYIE